MATKYQIPIKIRIHIQSQILSDIPIQAKVGHFLSGEEVVLPLSVNSFKTPKEFTFHLDDLELHKTTVEKLLSECRIQLTQREERNTEQLYFNVIHYWCFTLINYSNKKCLPRCQRENELCYYIIIKSELRNLFSLSFLLFCSQCVCKKCVNSISRISTKAILCFQDFDLTRGLNVSFFEFLFDTLYNISSASFNSKEKKVSRWRIFSL